MTEDHQDDKEESSQDKEHEETKAYANILKTINTLPDSHYAWGYLDPTRAYYGNENNEEYQARTDFINWYDMQIHNMAEIKATRFLIDYYNGPTVDTGDSRQPNQKMIGTSSKNEREHENQEDKGKQGNEERGPSIKTTTLTQLTQMDGGNEPVD
jgi:hypothetical protein